MSRLLVYFDDFLTWAVRQSRTQFLYQMRFPQFGLRVSTKEKIIFMKRLAMLLKAQLPIVAALQLLAHEKNQGAIKVIAKKLATDMSGGPTPSHETPPLETAIQ